MTGRQRIRTAMALGKPDRVPIFCQLAAGHYFLNSRIAPIDIWFRSDGLAEAMIELQQRYQFDGILVNLPGRDPDFEQQLQRVERKQADRETWLWWSNGNYTRVPDDDNPHYFMANGERHFPTFDEVEPETLWYIEPWDLTEITYPYTWSFDKEPRSFDNFFPNYHCDSIRQIKNRVGHQISVHSEIFSPFSQIMELLNYEQALMGLLDDPGKSHAMLERFTLGAIDLGKQQADEGVDAILISSAFAGAGFISRENYRTFVLPYEKKVIAEIRAHTPGLKLYTHTCGAIGDRLDLMLETGTNGIDTLDPPPLGTVELKDACPMLRGKAFIKGNLDPVNTLLHGDEAKVRAAVERCMCQAKPQGGYILSSACSVAPAVKPGLLEYLSTLARELGAY
jgi:uroporphyrinogen decarboxylase-like protein